MLNVSGLSKRFGPVRAVRDVSFSLARGRITAMLGENGAGKTTTLKMILGFLRRDSGTIEIVAARPAYVPDHPAFFPWLTGAAFLDLTARSAGIGRAMFAAGVRGVCERLLFDPAFLERRPAAYSAGNAKKFAYLQNLALAPDLLLADEPFSGLDPTSMRRLREEFAALKKTGTAILLSSHMLAEMDRIADDFILIRRGEVAARSSLRDYAFRLPSGCGRDLESIFTALTQP